MSDRTDDREFYVGYRGRAPRGIAAFVRGRVVGLLIFAAVLGVGLASLQRPADLGVFEFGEPRELTGIVRERPWPRLELEQPAGDGTARSRYPLVSQGKHGAQQLVAGLDGARVRLRGTLVWNDLATLVEVVPGTLERLEESTLPVVEMEGLGEVTLRGEIVDSKCFLGVMKPGRTKPHRACAANCLRGGIPPMLLVETTSGQRQLWLLVDEDGGPVGEKVIELAARPVEVTGRARREGDLLILAADPTRYRPLG